MNILKKAAQKYRSFPTPVKASFFFVFCGVFKDVVDVIRNKGGVYAMAFAQ